MSQRDQLGARALELLAEQWMIPVLQALSDGSTRPAELERRLPHVGHSTVIRRLRRLLDSELVTYEHRPGMPPHARSAGTPQQAHYGLTDAGRTLLEVTAHARRWERIFPEFEYEMKAPSHPSESRRHHLTELPPAERARNFEEASLGLTAVEAMEECCRCLRCDVRDGDQ